MGYLCPVCEDPQADGAHLANHLAFTAMLGDDDHADWLDEHVPDWADADPSSLAPRVADRAEETEFPQVFEDTAGGQEPDRSHDHDHARDRRDAGPGSGVPDGMADLDAALGTDEGRDAEDVLAEARELTRRRRANRSGDGADGDGDDEQSETE